MNVVFCLVCLMLFSLNVYGNIGDNTNQLIAKYGPIRFSKPQYFHYDGNDEQKEEYGKLLVFAVEGVALNCTIINDICESIYYESDAPLTDEYINSILSHYAPLKDWKKTDNFDKEKSIELLDYKNRMLSASIKDKNSIVILSNLFITSLNKAKFKLDEKTGVTVSFNSNNRSNTDINVKEKQMGKDSLSSDKRREYVLDFFYSNQRVKDFIQSTSPDLDEKDKAYLYKILTERRDGYFIKASFILASEGVSNVEFSDLYENIFGKSTDRNVLATAIKIGALVKRQPQYASIFDETVKSEAFFLALSEEGISKESFNLFYNSIPSSQENVNPLIVIAIRAGKASVNFKNDVNSFENESRNIIKSKISP